MKDQQTKALRWCNGVRSTLTEGSGSETLAFIRFLVL